jgi:hypothetical protein
MPVCNLQQHSIEKRVAQKAALFFLPMIVSSPERMQYLIPNVVLPLPSAKGSEKHLTHVKYD